MQSAVTQLSEAAGGCQNYSLGQEESHLSIYRQG